MKKKNILTLLDDVMCLSYHFFSLSDLPIEENSTRITQLKDFGTTCKTSETSPI